MTADVPNASAATKQTPVIVVTDFPMSAVTFRLVAIAVEIKQMTMHAPHTAVARNLMNRRAAVLQLTSRHQRLIPSAQSMRTGIRKSPRCTDNAT